MSNRTGRTTRLIAGGVLGLSALAFAPNTAGAAINTDAFCANVPAGQSGFTDIALAGVHTDNVECLKASGVTAGTTATTYSPQQNITRGQMATFVANMIDRANQLDAPGGTTIPDLPTAAASADAFTDDEGNTHEDNINRLAQADIVQGQTATTFNPNGNVTRAQMATFIAEALDFIRGGALPEGADAFTDDETSVHEANINRLANADIVDGPGGGLYSPNGLVSRAQMASFIIQGMADLHADGFITPVPPASGVTVTPDAAATQADGSARLYTANAVSADGTPFAGVVTIQLFNVNAQGQPDRTGAAPTCAAIQQVDGGAPLGPTTATTFAGPDGQVTFLIRDAAGGTTCTVVPEVFADLDGDTVRDAGETDLGGTVSFPFVPAEAVDLSVVVNDLVCAVSRTAGSEFVVLSGGDGNCLNADELRYDFDNNDVFAGAEAPSFAAFLAQVSVGDLVTVNPYRRDAAQQSTFQLTNQTVPVSVASPAAPTNVDANTFTIAGAAATGFTVTVYRDVNDDGADGDNDFQLGTDVPLASAVVGDSGTYAISVPLIQNAVNNFVVVQRPAGQAENTAPVDAVRDTQGVPAITESPTAARPIVTVATGANVAPSAAGTLSPSDTITLTFNENMAFAANASLTLIDSDGTQVVLTRGVQYSVVLSDGGDADATNGDVATITLIGVPVGSPAGTTGGLQSPAEITASSGVTALSDGAALNLPSSTDRVVEGF